MPHFCEHGNFCLLYEIFQNGLAWEGWSLRRIIFEIFWRIFENVSANFVLFSNLEKRIYAKYFSGNWCEAVLTFKNVSRRRPNCVKKFWIESPLNQRHFMWYFSSIKDTLKTPLYFSPKNQNFWNSLVHKS